MEVSVKERLGISSVTFHNLSIPVWCNDVAPKLIHFQIPPCVTLTGHTTVLACLGDSLGEILIDS